MPSFGRNMARLDLGPYKPLEAQPMGDKSQAGQRIVNSAAGGSGTPGAATGWRGAFMRKNIPRTLQILGATLQQIDNPQGQLDAFSANEADQQRQAAAEMAQARTGKMQDQQSAQLERAISSLPPDQQAWARLNPEAFISALMQSQTQQATQRARESQWRNDGTRPYRIVNGRVEYGEGTIPHVPRAPLIQYGSPGDDDLEPYP